MQKYSNSEYDYLKKEVNEIKNCITRYIGYIISVSGITAIVVNYFSKDVNSVTSDSIVLLAVFSSIVVITFLFEVIWYKFRSHNRFVGYIQLISQEVKAYSKPKPTKKNSKLDEFKRDDSKIFDAEKEIVSWEFIMARYNNVARNKSLLKITEAIQKIQFELSPLNSRDLSLIKYDTSREIRKNLMLDYYLSIIYPQYDRNGSFLKKTGKKLINGLVNIWLMWLPPSNLNWYQKIDRNYLSISWVYPQKILQMAFLIFIGISGVLFYLLSSNNDFSIDNLQWNFPTIIVFLWLIVLFHWIFGYVSNIGEVLTGRYSIDYYCWLFFIFRVQILNANGIVPEYYAKGYKRFLKSYLIQNVISLFKTNTSNYLEIAKEEYLAKDESFEEYEAKLIESHDFKGKYEKIHAFFKKKTNKIYKITPPLRNFEL